jgi:hypothetical protein
MKKLALLLVAAPLALAACGGSSKALKVDPVAYVKHAANRTVATTEHLAMTGSMSVAGQSGSLKMSMSGDFGSSPLQGNLQFAMTAPDTNVKFSEIVDGKTLYLRAPGMPGGKSWLKADLATVSASTHIDLLQSMSQSPVQALQRLEAAGTVKQVGTDTIDGVQTTHFQVTNLDPSKLVHGAKFLNPNDVKFGVIDVWVGNDNGYVYRETVPLTLDVDGQTGTMTMQVDLSKFGEAVHVNVPPAKDTVDLTQLMQDHAS